jgi:hypothetical protein
VTLRLRRLLLLAGMALAAVNLFTGAPLLAIWLGARVQGDEGGLTMTAVLVVVVTLALLCWALIWVLNRLGAAHDRAVGRPPGRRRAPWLKPFNEAAGGAQGAGLRALDAILVAAVVLAGLAFEVWFFFYAGASI